MTPNRNRAVSPLSRSSVTAYPATGAANARPVSSPTGISNAASGDWIAPNKAMTTRKIEHTISTRIPIHVRCPASRSRTRSGVASMAS